MDGSNYISDEIWDEIKKDFLKQVGLAILDFMTFRAALNEDDFHKLIPAPVRSIALTDTSSKMSHLDAYFSEASKKEIDRNLTWAIIDGYLVAACLHYDFRFQDLESHSLSVNEWQGNRGSNEAIEREWAMYEFSHDDGLKILYSKRPVTRIILEELFSNRDFGGTELEVSEFCSNSGDYSELVTGGLMINGLVGASLFEFNVNDTSAKDLNHSWLQRANTIFELKPNVAGVGVNINAIIDYLFNK